MGLFWSLSNRRGGKSVIPWYTSSRTPCRYKSPQMLLPRDTMALHLHITYAHPAIPFQLPLGFLHYLHNVNSFYTKLIRVQ